MSESTVQIAYHDVFGYDITKDVELINALHDAGIQYELTFQPGQGVEIVVAWPEFNRDMPPLISAKVAL